MQSTTLRAHLRILYRLDLDKALDAHPYDRTIRAEWDELQRLMEMSEGERAEWLKANKGVPSSVTFGIAGNEQLVAEGRRIREECETENE